MNTSSDSRDRRTKAELADEIKQLQNQIKQISQKMEEAKVPVTVRIPVSLRDAIRSVAAEKNLSIQEIFEESLKESLNRLTT